MDSIKRDYILVSHAGDYNVELSKEDEDKIAEAVNAFLSSNTPQALNEMGATKDIVTEYLKNRTIATRVRTAIEDSAPEDTEDEEDSSESYSDKMISDWEEELDFDVVESQWKKVRFVNLFAAADSDTPEETTEDTAEDAAEDVAEDAAE